jgi:hypothetical protein
LFRQNSQNAHDGTLFHHPAKVGHNHSPVDATNPK